MDEDEYREDAEDELPTVVVLNSGDLTAEEASQEKERLDRGENRFQLSCSYQIALISIHSDKGINKKFNKKKFHWHQSSIALCALVRMRQIVAGFQNRETNTFKLSATLHLTIALLTPSTKHSFHTKR